MLWNSFLIKGKDASSYLNGQLSSDIKTLHNGQAQLSVRLDRSGRIVAPLYLLRENEETYYVVSPEWCSNDLKKDIEKYIISEDVSILASPSFTFLPFKELIKNASLISQGNIFVGPFYRDLGVYVKLNNQELPFSLNHTSDEVEFGFDFFDPNNLGKIVNETILVQDAVSFTKGCYLGQETVCKIENNRKAQWFPMKITLDKLISRDDVTEVYKNDELIGKIFLKPTLNNKNVYSAYISREHRRNGPFEGITINNEKLNVELSSYQKTSEEHKSKYFKTLFDEAVGQCHKNNTYLSDAFFRLAFYVKPEDQELCESYGAFLNGHKRYEECLKVMDIFLKINRKSQLAHVNKSIAYMNLGQIEKAETEKALASEVNKLTENSQQIGTFDQSVVQNDKKNLYLEVLKIDPEDSMANAGLAEILMREQKFNESYAHYKKLSVDEKFPLRHAIHFASVMDKLAMDNELENYVLSVIKIAQKKGNSELVYNLEKYLKS